MLKEWTAKAKSLQGADDDIKRRMPSHFKSILMPKRIALWKQILEDYRYPDMSVVDELVDGTCLTGVVSPVPLFDKKFKPATVSVDELTEGARASREALIHSVRSSGDEFIDTEVYRKIVLELGW